jgi:hypothetical protein
VCQQRWNERIVFGDWKRVKRPVGLRDAERLRLRGARIAAAEEAAVYARGGVQPLVREHAATVRIGERHNHELATPDPVDVPADLLDDPDRLMAHATSDALTIDLQVVIGPQSLPQMQAQVIRRTALVGSRIAASGTFSIRTSRAWCIAVARSSLSPLFAIGQQR